MIIFARARLHDPAEDGDYSITVSGRHVHRSHRHRGVWHHDMNQPLSWWKRVRFWLWGMVTGRFRVEFVPTEDRDEKGPV